MTPLLQNAYFTELNVDPSALMAVDLMHDVELGVGKAIVMHVLWLLLAQGQGVIEKFDAWSVLSSVVKPRLS